MAKPRARWYLFIAVFIIAFLQPLAANFAGSEVILPAAGRVIGAGGREFITTVWLNNPTDHPIDVQRQKLYPESAGRAARTEGR